MRSSTKWVLAHQRTVVILWVVLTLAGMAAAGPVSKQLSQDYSVPGREGWETNQQITRLLGTGGNSAPLLAVVTLPSGAAVASARVRAGLTDVMQRARRAVPGVRLASYASDPGGAFVSRDGRTTFVVAYPVPEKGKFGQSPRAERELRAALRGVTVAGSPVHLTGLDALQSTPSGRGGPGVLVESLIGGLGALLVLVVVFASLQALVPLAIAVASIMTSFLLVWGLAQLTEVSALVQFLIALVGLGVAIDYSLLVVVRWREERAAGRDGHEAIIRTMETAGRAAVLSGTTVAIGLLALIALPVPFLRSVGYGGIVIPLVSVLAAITLLPIILARWGTKLEWPHRPDRDSASRSWTRWGQLVLRRRGWAAVLGGSLLVALVVAATGLQFGAAAGNPDIIASAGDAKAGLAALERSGIGAGALTPIEVLAPADAGTRVEAALAGGSGIHGAVAPQGTDWRRGDRAVVDVFPTRTDATSAGRAALRRTRAVAHGVGRRAAPPAAGGIMAQNQDFVSAVYGSFPLMVVLIAVITLVLLTRAFRSLLLPLKAVVLNVLSVAAAWGALVLIWQKGWGSEAIWGIPAAGSIPSWMPVVIFAFLFGLSMDYEVFILSRMREAYDATGSTREAVVVGIGRTGRLVTSAALILFLAFVAMAAGPQVQLKMMATGLATGILIDATLIRALLVPALVSLFGRWNWWLPAAPARALLVEPSPLGAAEAVAGATGPH
jgi:RND superfamily putative drug exporter